MPTPEISRQINARLQELYQHQLSAADRGVERYYESGRGYYRPDLARDERDQVGIALAGLEGDVYTAGEHLLRFPLHSISKVFSYALALQDHGRDAVLLRVGVEPSGDAYNSLTFDEYNGRPHNPMVNAGALATTELVCGANPDEKLERILDLVRRLAGNDRLVVDGDVFHRELETADRNRGTGYLMRSTGMLSRDVEETLALYLRQCAITVTSVDLAVIAATLANGGVNPLSAERFLSPLVNRDVLSVMLTCGMYDFAGEWAYQVGAPAKSGVSGGIVAVIPRKLGIGVFSPGLDRFGNSVRGVRVCQEVSERLGLHIFAGEAEDLVLRPPRAATEPPSVTEGSPPG